MLFAALFAINVLNYADRYVVPAVASELKLDLHLSDGELGLLGSAFLLVYALAAVPAGSIADRTRRTTVIALGVGLWSVATLLTGLTRSFVQLFGARALLGVGEASYFPPATSLLADAFPVERRARVMGWWGVASPVGVFLGFGAGGFVASRLGWRAAFFLTALPGLLLALLVARLVEPRRGASEKLGATDAAAPSLTVAGEILRIRTLRSSILTQALSFFVLGGVSYWIPSYLNRHYGLDVAAAGALAGGIVVGGGGIGTILGGYLADALLARGVSGARMLVPAVGDLLAAPVVLAGILTGSLNVFLVAFFLAAVLLQVYSGPLSALSQDVVVPARRARAVALSLLLAHLLGDAFAPLVVGALSDALGSLQQALLTAPAALLGAAVVAFVGARWVEADRVTMLQEASVAPSSSEHLERR